MKMTFKKIISILCVFIFAVTFAVGCNNSQNTPTPPPVVDSGVKYATDDSGKEILLVDDRKSEYKIVVADDAHNVEMIAAEELQKYLQESTKCRLPIVKESELLVDQTKVLSIGNTNLFANSGTTLEYDVYGDSGTFVNVDGYKVFIAGARPVGTVYAVYEFLGKVIGFEAYATDEVCFNKTDSIKLVDFDNFSSIPAIQERTPTYGEIKDPKKAMVLRLVGNVSLYGQVWGVANHSIERLCDKNSFPQWFPYGQICMSNVEACEYVANKLISQIASMPNTSYWELGHGDNSIACKCDDCIASATKYGGQGGLYVQWLNRVGKIVEDWQTENNIDREIWIVGLAYRGYADPPAVKNADGTYSPMDDTVKCRDNVAIRYAPIEACYAHSIFDKDCPKNASGLYAENMKKWIACSPKRLWIWLYSCEYYDYQFPMNDWGQLVESYKFYEEIGIFSVKDEMQPCDRAPFSALKLYVRSKLLWDTSYDYNKLIDNFFTNFYKEAAPYMREYYDAVRAQFVKLGLPAEQGGYTTDGTSGCYINNSGHGMVYYDSAYWSFDLLKKYQKIIDKAYEALQQVGYSEEEYEKLRLRVRADEMLIAHYYVNSYERYFSEADYAKIKAQYEEDFYKLGMVVWGS